MDMFAKVSAAFLFILSLSICNAAPVGLSVDIRMNTNARVFKSIALQINREYEAMYFYEILAFHFKHPIVGKSGFSKFFRIRADEKLEHARKLTQYVSDRGMPLTSSFRMIMPYRNRPEGITKAIVAALKIEMRINASLLKLHKEADTAGDPDLQEFLRTNYLCKQVKLIRNLRIMLSRLVNSNNQKDIAFLMDQELLRG